MNKDKFTNKSSIYDKYRPNYPANLIEYLYIKERIKEYILNYFDNELKLNIDEFIGRCLSRSYSLSENNSIYCEYIDRLKAIYHDNSKYDKFFIKNKTRSMIGMVK